MFNIFMNYLIMVNNQYIIIIFDMLKLKRNHVYLHD